MKDYAIPVIVDEMNMIHQLHRINVEGLSWPSFFRALSKYTNTTVNPYFACANVKDNEEFSRKRQFFFESLRKRGVRVLEGFSVRGKNKGTDKRIEKGVDVLVALQIYKEALYGAADIFVCSADTDLLPAVKEAQKLGSRVHLVISEYAPAYELAACSDKIISLEQVLNLMDQDLRFIDTTKPYIHTKAKSFKSERRGVCYS